MSDKVNELLSNIKKWRESGPENYWISIGYIGAELNRFGDQVLVVADGETYHQRFDGGWRKLEKGSDFWLFTVVGTFAWARDMLTKAIPHAGVDADEAIDIRYAPEGYINHMNVKVARRDALNFTLDVRGVAEGAHPEFEKPE